MMNKMTLALLGMILSVSALAQKTDDGSIPWNADRLLTWEDFQKKAPKRHEASAMSNISFLVDMRVSGEVMTVFVQSSFIPEGSWVKQEDKSDHLLKHEQVHFDIYEVYARKLREELKTKKLTTNNVQSTVTRLIEKYQAMSIKESQKYDAETDHSIKKEKQYEWNDEIAEELESLNEHASPSIEATVKIR